MAGKFTFRTDKPTGRYRGFDKSYTYIKLKGKQVGTISSRDRVDVPPFYISFMVTKADINENGNPNCTWKWITLKKTCGSIDAAKEFVNEHFESIIVRYNIYTGD